MAKTLRLNLVIIFLLSAFSFSSCETSRKTIAIEEGWELLGEKNVNFGKDKDIFMVNSNSQFTDIRFRVEDREIKIRELNVVFQNGDKLNPAIEETVTPGQESKIIQISTEGKYLRSIEFNYRTKGNILKGRAKVLVFGKRYTGY